MKRIIEKKHRLPPELYIGIKTISYTKCVLNRDHLFTSDNIFRVFETFLLKSLERYSCEAIVYLFMPDHAHVLLSGKTDQSNSLKAMYYFNQISGFWLHANKPEVKWQKDFYDHILRKEEEVEKHIRYILNNPVSKGLVKHWRDYPYKGSTVYNLEELWF